VPASALLVPLDTHVARIARYLGLTDREDLTWRTAEEITAGLRRLDPADPVRFDFALCHHGMSGACPVRRDPAKCAVCPLRDECRAKPRALQAEGAGGGAGGSGSRAR
jgi:endonuclease III